MAEWLTLNEAAARCGYSSSWLCRLIRRGKIPAEHSRRNGKLVYITAEMTEWLRQRKLNNAGWTMTEPEQPSDAKHVPDPDGVYCGFWLTPAQEMRLAVIRVNLRLRGLTEQRYKQLPRMLRSLGDG